MEGKELQLATDPDCSIILERLVHSMDDFAQRVLLDKLAGSYVSQYSQPAHLLPIRYLQVFETCKAQICVSRLPNQLHPRP